MALDQDVLQFPDFLERFARDQLVPEASIGWPCSLSRHRPSALKFSRASPSGSIRAWHEAQDGLAAVQGQRLAEGRVRPPTFLPASSSGGMFGGGGGGASPGCCRG